jgi:hypothetical protein
MLKPLTMSLSLAVALSLCSVSMAGGYDQNCKTCGLASPQGVYPSHQGSYVTGCEAPCAPKHHFNFHLPKFHHEVCYEWVLKKKHSWSMHHQPSCDTCGVAPIYPTGQHGPSPQYTGPSGQYSGTSGQYSGTSGQYSGMSGQYSAPQVYGGVGQRGFLPSRSTTSIASVPAEMTPATPVGEEVPPAPEVKESSATGSQGGLLLPTPSGN